MTALDRAALRQYRKCLRFLRECGGKAHSSVRESMVDYGRMGRLDDSQIKSDLQAAGVCEADVQGALKGGR